MTDKKKQALEMYMSGTAPQTQIAAQVGISERTLYSWIKDNGWDRLRQASLAAPIMIADELCTQLINLQRSIAAREEGQQFPTLQEANITGKLIMSLGRLKNFPSISQSLQVLQAFRHYVRDRNKDAAWQVGHYMESFLEDRAKFGYVPSQPEYGINPVNPFGTAPEHMSPPLGGGREGLAHMSPPLVGGREGLSHMSPPLGGGREGLSHMSPPLGGGREGLSHMSPPLGGGRVGLSHMSPPLGGGRVGLGNSESEILTAQSAQIPENKEIAENNTSFHHLQQPEISGNREALDRSIDTTAIAGYGKAHASSRGEQEGVCDGCLPWHTHEMMDALLDDCSYEGPSNREEEPNYIGNPAPEITTIENHLAIENERFAHQTTYFRHQPARRSFSKGGQEPAISGNEDECSETSRGTTPNPAPHTHMSPPSGGGRVGLSVNWEDGPNPLPRSVIFTLPGGNKEEVPFAGLVEAQVRKSIGNRQLSAELYEAHRKAAEMTLAGNLMDKKYHLLGLIKKAS